MNLLYLGALLVSFAGVLAIDARWRVFVFAAPRRAAVVLGVGAILFVVWDVLAIAFGFYGRGESPALSGVWLAPHFPLEELVFILFLCEVTMVAHGLVARLLLPSAGARDGSEDDA